MQVTDDPNSIVIGLHFSFCGWDCAQFYKLENGKLYTDTVEWIKAGSIPSFSDDPLGNAQAIAEVIKLDTEFPAYLRETEETTFGCPDCGDWGSIVIVKNIEGTERHWTLDNQIASNPTEIQDWVTSVRTLLYELSN